MFQHIIKIAAAVIFGLVLNNLAYSQGSSDFYEVYSNADGSVQFIVLEFGPFDTPELPVLAGQTLIASDGKTDHRFTFTSNVINYSTACDVSVSGPFCAYYVYVLVATQGFADVNVVKPDFVVPNRFVFLSNGSVRLGVIEAHYEALPVDGRNALWYNAGEVLAGEAFNNAGEGYSFGGVERNQHGLTGSWYNPATSGQGLEVEVFPDLSSPGNGLIQAGWFTYDTVAGGAARQRWYTLSGPVVTGQPNASLTIYQNIGGNFDAPPTTAATAVGTATLNFDTCTSGQMSYTFTDGSGRTGTVPLSRLTQNMTCSTTSARPTNADFALSGNWYAAATSGQGFTVEVNPNSGTLFFGWYTYAPSGTNAGAAGQRWYTGEAGYAPGSRSIPVQLYETTGGTFNAAAPAPNTVAVGSGTLAFQSCSGATLSYNFTGGSSSGASGTITLGRIGPVPIGCNWDY